MDRKTVAAKLSAEKLLVAPDVPKVNAIHSALSAAVMAGEITDYQLSDPGDGVRWLIWGPGFEHRFGPDEAFAYVLGLQTAFRAGTKR